MQVGEHAPAPTMNSRIARPAPKTSEKRDLLARRAAPPRSRPTSIAEIENAFIASDIVSTSATTPRMIGLRIHACVLGGRVQVVLLGVDGAVRRAHGDGPVVLAAHHDALEDRLAADVRVLDRRVEALDCCIAHSGLPFRGFAGTARRTSSCPRGTDRAGTTRRRP